MQESLVVEKISHPEYCRVQNGKVQVKLGKEKLV